jgi:Mrp family chromosome partitioning ATPase
MLAAIDTVLEHRPIIPGFALRTQEPLNAVALPPWFIDRCRQVYLSVSFDDASRVIGVTSALRGEGKTSVALGVAMAIAADTCEPTLLLEADLERPSFGRILGLETNGDLSDLVSDRPPIKVVRMPYLPHLVVLPAGAPSRDPARLLYRMSEGNTIGELKARFRNVILDLPPVLTAPYSSLALRLAERLVVVARFGVSQEDDLEKVVFLLGSERVSGVVLNGTHYRTPSWLRRLL